MFWYINNGKKQRPPWPVVASLQLNLIDAAKVGYYRLTPANVMRRLGLKSGIKLLPIFKNQAQCLNATNIATNATNIALIAGYWVSSDDDTRHGIIIEELLKRHRQIKVALKPRYFITWSRVPRGMLLPRRPPKRASGVAGYHSSFVWSRTG